MYNVLGRIGNKSHNMKESCNVILQLSFCVKDISGYLTRIFLPSMM